MNRQIRHRAIAATALAALLAGGAATAATPQHRDDSQARKEQRQDHRQDRRDDNREAAQVRRDVRREAVQSVRDDRREAVQARRDVVQPQRGTLQDRREALQQRAVIEARRDDARDAVQDRRDDRRDWRQDQRQDRQDAHQDRRDDRQDARQDRRDDRHDWRQDRRDDRNDARRDAQRRIAYTRYRQDYDHRMRDYRVRIAPRYYIRPAHYRYFWGGTWYTTSNYGADMLRQAVDFGYREGLRAGRADRYDGWPADYRDSIAWRNGGFGYAGRYITRADYEYYFRQGFQRGYDDGYFGRMQYGHYVNNDAVIAEAVIATILGLQLLR
ncbi:MAG: hypothetical protein ACTHOC_01530 [Luteimonas sp.]